MKRKIITPIVYAVILILFILGTFFDKNISLALADLNKGEYFTKNFFAIGIEIFGELPIIILLSLSIAVVGYNISKKSKDLKLVFIIATLLICFVVYVIGVYRCVEYLAEIYDFKLEIDDTVWDEVITLVISALLTGVNVIFVRLCGDKVLTKLYYFCLATCVVIAFGLVYTNLLKIIISRPRFRTLNIIGLENYSPWYKIYDNGGYNYHLSIINEDGFRSFPSGHVSWTTSCLVFCFLPKFLQLGKKTKIILYVVPGVWTGLVALSRIIAGAHYLTDVTFSIIVTMLSIEVSFLICKLLKKKADKKKEEELKKQEEIDLEELRQLEEL